VSRRPKWASLWGSRQKSFSATDAPEHIAYGYATALAVVSICTAVSLAGEGVLDVADRVLLFPLGVLVVSARFGIGPGIFAAVSGIVVFDYLFVPPTLTFAVGSKKSALTLGITWTVTMVISVLTDRLRRQAERARRHAELERLRNALLSSMSHDLRGPLTAIVGASTALHNHHLEPIERRALARMVLEEAQRLSGLVGNLLELTRLESGTVRAKGSLQAIDEVIGSALHRLEAKLVGRTVRTDVPEEIPLATFDPVLIEQVLVNLMDNALRYTPEGSSIDVVVRARDPWIVVEIADRGPGVPPGDEEKVFERLHRGERRSDGGVGLGLTICRAIVTAHEGRIWLENRSDGGASVKFTLPADDRGHTDAKALALGELAPERSFSETTRP
jgi:K+-sensing histidine kinase KdpD